MREYRVQGCDIAPTHSAVVELGGRPGHVELVSVTILGGNVKDTAVVAEAASNGVRADITKFPSSKELALELSENLGVYAQIQWLASAQRHRVGPPLDLICIEGWPYNAKQGAHQAGAASAAARALYHIDVPRRLHDVYAVKIAATGKGSTDSDSKAEVCAAAVASAPQLKLLAKIKKTSFEDVCDAYWLAMTGLYEMAARESGVDPTWPEQMRRVLLRTTNQYPEAPVSRELLSLPAVYTRTIGGSE